MNSCINMDFDTIPQYSSYGCGLAAAASGRWRRARWAARQQGRSACAPAKGGREGLKGRGRQVPRAGPESHFTVTATEDRWAAVSPHRSRRPAAAHTSRSQAADFRSCPNRYPAAVAAAAATTAAAFQCRGSPSLLLTPGRRRRRRRIRWCARRRPGRSPRGRRSLPYCLGREGHQFSGICELHHEINMNL